MTTLVNALTMCESVLAHLSKRVSFICLWAYYLAPPGISALTGRERFHLVHFCVPGGEWCTWHRTGTQIFGEREKKKKGGREGRRGEGWEREVDSSPPPALTPKFWILYSLHPSPLPPTSPAGLTVQLASLFVTFHISFFICDFLLLCVLGASPVHR